VSRKVWNMRRPMLVSLGAGLLTGYISYLAGPVLSAVALGLCGAAMSFVGFLVAPFMRLWQSLQEQDA
jgi:hypothetical protein